jgi:translation initiation factor 4G
MLIQGNPGGLSSNLTRSQRHKQRNGGKMAARAAHAAAPKNSRKVEHIADIEVVSWNVRYLLNKLTMEKFDSISDQIIEWVNKSENGRTLIQVIHLVVEKAIDEATWPEMYARLCRKMMEQISNEVQDDGIRNPEGKPIAGG